MTHSSPVPCIARLLSTSASCSGWVVRSRGTLRSTLKATPVHGATSMTEVGSRDHLGQVYTNIKNPQRSSCHISCKIWVLKKWLNKAKSPDFIRKSPMAMNEENPDPENQVGKVLLPGILSKSTERVFQSSYPLCCLREVTVSADAD